jgi:acylphosphatase
MEDRMRADLVRKRLRIRGRVQGVWFRGATQDEARRLGITGWVRNCPDGSVEAVVQGPTEAVRLLVEWCGHGPPGARVTSCSVEDEPPASESIDFRIR